MNLAICLHLHQQVGQLEEFVHRFSTVKHASKGRCDLFVTTTDRATRQVAREAFSHFSDVNTIVVIDVVENRGLDIGPFLLQLDKIFHGDAPSTYDVLFKWHAKSNKALRTIAHDRMCASEERVAQTLASLASQENGAACALRCNHQHHMHKNETWLRFICNELKIPYPTPEQLFFPACTVFACKTSVLEPWWRKLRDMYKYANGPEDVDWAWLCAKRGHVADATPELGKELAKTVRTKPPFVGHAYWPNAPLGPRDGMFEHGMERLFGYLLGAHAGKEVVQLEPATSPIAKRTMCTM